MQLNYQRLLIFGQNGYLCDVLKYDPDFGWMAVILPIFFCHVKQKKKKRKEKATFGIV